MYAEDLNYWQTSKAAADEWVDKALKLIKEIKGEILSQAFGSSGGRAAYMIQFKIGEDTFKVVWPVLRPRGGNEVAARRQAATLLFYDIKSKVLTAKVLGNRAAFFSYIMLPDGRSASEAATFEISQSFPLLLKQEFPK